jgi:hypothetical protein
MARPGLEPGTPRFSGTRIWAGKRRKSPANRRVADPRCCTSIPVDWCSCPRVKDVARPPRPFRLLCGLLCADRCLGHTASVAPLRLSRLLRLIPRGRVRCQQWDARSLRYAVARGCRGKQKRFTPSPELLTFLPDRLTMITVEQDGVRTDERVRAGRWLARFEPTRPAGAGALPRAIATARRRDAVRSWVPIAGCPSGTRPLPPRGAKARRRRERDA